MKAFAFFLALIASTSATVPGQVRPDCDGQLFFGPYASHFNTFVFGDFVGRWSDTEGRLFAGGDISLDSWAVGCRLYTRDNCISFGSVSCAHVEAQGDLRDSLVSGGNMNVRDTEVKVGDVVHGGSLSATSLNVVQDCATKQRATEVANAKTFLEELTLRVAALETTGTVINNFGSLTFQGSFQTTTEVFSVTAAQLASANGISFTNLQLTASVFVNVVGDGELTVGNFGFLGQFPFTHVLWNFPSITTLTVRNVGWYGSILAPFADMVDSTSGVIHGQTFAKSFVNAPNQASIQQNEEPFIGCLPRVDPPPPIGEVCEGVFGELPSLFNTFVFENFDCYNSDTEGRLAAGSNISVASYAIGCQITVEDPDVNCINFGSVTCGDLATQGIFADSAVAGQDFTSVDLEVKVGNIVHGGEFNGVSTTIVSDCQTRQASPINFSEAQELLKERSACAASQPATGSVTVVHKELVLKGTNADREVFHISGELFTTVKGFKISDVKEDATLIFNVNGVHLSIGGFDFPQDTSVYNFQNAIFNFYEAEILTLFNVGWRGSVLAPYADIVNPTGVIKGQTFARSWLAPRDGACMQQDDFPFLGCLPVCE